MTIVNLAKIRTHFNFVNPSARKFARTKALLYIDNLGLPSLPPGQCALLCEREIHNLVLEINNFDGREYIRFVLYDRFLYNIYAARMLFCHLNDEVKLREAFIRYEKLLLLREHYKSAIAQIPGSSFVNFEENYEHVVIKLPGQHPHSPDVDELLRSYQIVDLISCMAPDQPLLDRLYETITWIEKEVNNQKIPSNFIIEHINHSYDELYRNALYRFKEQIESSTHDSMAVFIINQSRDIKFMIGMAKSEGYTLHCHFKHFLHFLNDQRHIIKWAQGFKQPDVTGLISKTDMAEEKPVTFGPRPGPRALRPILVAMNLHYNLLGSSTTVDDLMEVLTCPDLSKNTKIIQLGIKYNLLYCFIKKLKPWFTLLKPSTMERSGIFISPNEGPLLAQSLYNSGVVLMEDDDKIEAIVKAKYQ